MLWYSMMPVMATCRLQGEEEPLRSPAEHEPCELRHRSFEDAQVLELQIKRVHPKVKVRNGTNSRMDERGRPQEAVAPLM
jgi:hypothetical protein